MVKDLYYIIKKNEKKTANKTRFYRTLKNRGTVITAVILIGLSAIAIWKDVYYIKNYPEKFYNFKEIQNIENYRIKNNNFTEGDIIEIEIIDGAECKYDTLSENPEEIRITGKFKYKIFNRKGY